MARPTIADLLSTMLSEAANPDPESDPLTAGLSGMTPDVKRSTFLDRFATEIVEKSIRETRECDAIEGRILMALRCGEIGDAILLSAMVAARLSHINEHMRGVRLVLGGVEAAAGEAPEHMIVDAKIGVLAGAIVTETYRRGEDLDQHVAAIVAHAAEHKGGCQCGLTSETANSVAEKITRLTVMQ